MDKSWRANDKGGGLKMQKEISFILKSIVQNYPILSEWGYTLKVPIALVVDNMRKFISILEILSPECRIINSDTSEKIGKQFFHEANSEAIFLIMPANFKKMSKNLERNLAFMLSSSSIGYVDDTKSCVANFIVCEKAVPTELKHSVFEIHITDCSKETSIKPVSVHPYAEELTMIRDKIKEIPLDEALPLKAAVAFLYPKLRYGSNKEKYDNLLQICMKLAVDAETYQEANDIFELVIDELISFLSENKTVCDLSETDVTQVDKIDEAIFVKNNAFFLAESLFKKIVEPLTKFYPIHLIKAELNAVGFLEGSNTGYTTKMSYKIQRELQRPRMLKFNLKDQEKLKSYLLI